MLHNDLMQSEDSQEYAMWYAIIDDTQRNKGKGHASSWVSRNNLICIIFPGAALHNRCFPCRLFGKGIRPHHPPWFHHETEFRLIILTKDWTRLLRSDPDLVCNDLSQDHPLTMFSWCCSNSLWQQSCGCFTQHHGYRSLSAAVSIYTGPYHSIPQLDSAYIRALRSKDYNMPGENEAKVQEMCNEFGWYGPEYKFKVGYFKQETCECIGLYFLCIPPQLSAHP